MTQPTSPSVRSRVRMLDQWEIDLIRETFSYDPETGFISRVKRLVLHAQMGPVTLTTAGGYITCKVKNEQYSGHRIAWLLHYGVWPRHGIDHINRVKTDNRIVNLREATPSQNNGNLPMPRHNSSGYKGVQIRNNGKYYSQIKCSGENFYLGTFDTAELAHAAYCAKAKDLFGEFARFK